VLWLPVAFEPWRAIPWPPPALPTAALLYLAIMGSVVAFASWFYLMKRVKLMTASTLVFVQPLIALVVDAFLEEAVTLSPRTHLGIGVTLAGVGVNLASQARSAARA
jgi:drug/metabolite transporter (DMT)-like permease